MTSISSNAPARGRLARIRSLARAELLQFVRNPTIMFMALVFPVGMTAGYYYLIPSMPGAEALAAGGAMEMFFFMAMMFVVYYAVLSMATTRRDERVLKRLRTGEATDTDILLAICTPASALAVLSAIVAVVVLLVMGAPLPVNPLLLAIALVGGITVSAALALITSAYTRNAEAAQLTSFPVMMLAMISLSSLREFLPERITQVLDWTPYALIGDLARLGWAGELTAAEGAATFASSLSDGTRMIGVLILSACLLMWYVPRVMKWETLR